MSGQPACLLQVVSEHARDFLRSRPPPPHPASKRPRRSIGRHDGGADLGYPEFVELIGLIAQEVGEARLLGLRASSSTGVSSSTAPPAGMLKKIALLFAAMFDNGAKFEGDAGRLVRAALAELRRGEHAAAPPPSPADVVERHRVRALLAETVMA